MIFNMMGSSSGSNVLNFKIIGGTNEPVNPSENTIWVNTEEEITGWEFSSSFLDTLEDGGIWFKTNTVTNMRFNALKQNTLMVYPLQAQQLVSGSLVNVSFNIYQNGAWLAPYVYLFANGNLFEDITGGWTGHAVCVNANNYLQAYNADNSGTATSGVSADAKTCNLIDLSNYGTLSVTAVTVGSSYGKIKLENSSGVIVKEVQFDEINNMPTEITVDITNINEECYIILHSYGNDSGNTGEGTSYASATFVASEVKLA